MRVAAALFLWFALLQPGLRADTVVLDFESFPDSTPLTTQFPGLTFSNATVITAGIGLDEFEFPPNSGTNVAFDDGAPITIDFAGPISIFGGYFTHTEPLTVTAFDANGNPVASASSLYSDNLGLSGDAGSSPNEYVGIDYDPGFSSVLIEADSGGDSFTMDDMTFGTPEPGTAALGLIALALTLGGGSAIRRGGPNSGRR